MGYFDDFARSDPSNGGREVVAKLSDAHPDHVAT
jgi:hypothetical protein